MKKFYEFLAQAKQQGKITRNAGRFVRNSLKNFDKLKNANFAMDQVDVLKLNNSKRSRIAEATKKNTQKMVD
ncbi:MAG: hypothetical protein LBG52_00225 [Candidatus Peribacteria bacterium]|jgi:uncharacterized membrane protein YobD (UPF0266 family)|nr:hypothetical protein [Candidatus Peribacteria bacterium]